MKARSEARLMASDAAKLPAEERPEWYRPARGSGQGAVAEPYEGGNVARLGAGHRSPRVYGQVSKALAAGLAETRPDLAAYPEALASWADAEARAALLRAHLDKQGTFDPETGELRVSLLSALDRFERRAAAARTQLGLDPRSEAELALLRAKALREGQLGHPASLETLAAQGRAALAAESDPVRDALEQVRREAARNAPAQRLSGPLAADSAECGSSVEG